MIKECIGHYKVDCVRYRTIHNLHCEYGIFALTSFNFSHQKKVNFMIFDTIRRCTWKSALT